MSQDTFISRSGRRVVSAADLESATPAAGSPHSSTGASGVALDPYWLGLWIKPHHLEPEQTQAYRRSFDAHAGILVIENLLRDAVFEQISRFLVEEVEYGPVYGLNSGRRFSTPEAWEQANEAERFCRFERIDQVRPEFQLSLNTVAFLKLRTRLQDARFRRFLETISGLKLGGCSIPRASSYRCGDFLKPHDDNFEGRRLTVVLYASPVWKAGFGGSLRMVNRGGDAVTEIAPVPNSMVIFDVTEGGEHYIESVEPAAGDHRRLSVGCWFHDFGWQDP